MCLRNCVNREHRFRQMTFGLPHSQFSIRFRFVRETGISNVFRNLLVFNPFSKVGAFGERAAEPGQRATIEVTFVTLVTESSLTPSLRHPESRVTASLKSLRHYVLKRCHCVTQSLRHPRTRVPVESFRLHRKQTVVESMVENLQGAKRNQMTEL